MLIYIPNKGATAFFRSPDGRETGSGPFDASADWTKVPSGDDAAYNAAFSKRYGGLPFDRERHWHARVASEFRETVFAGLVPYALAHGWQPNGGTFSGEGDLSPLSLYDLVFTEPSITDEWVKQWRDRRLAEPGWTTPRPARDTGRPTKGTWAWYLERILNGHGERFAEWNSPAFAGHQRQAFDLIVAKLRAAKAAGVDIDEVTISSAHWAILQPSLLLEALDGVAPEAFGASPITDNGDGTYTVKVNRSGLSQKDVLGLIAVLLGEVM